MQAGEGNISARVAFSKTVLTVILVFASGCRYDQVVPKEEELSRYPWMSSPKTSVAGDGFFLKFGIILVFRGVHRVA